MADVLHGNASGDQLNARADKTQVYGLKGNDTLTSDGKSDVLLVGGSGNDKLIMLGGNGTLSGGAGKDTFELNYSATKPLTAVIEDLEPSEDKIVVNFDGTGDAEQDNRFFEMLKLTNDERENPTNVPGQSIAVQTNLPALTLSDGLTKAAQICLSIIASSASDMNTSTSVLFQANTITGNNFSAAVSAQAKWEPSARRSF